MIYRVVDRTTVVGPRPLAFMGKLAQNSPTNCEAKYGTQSGGRSEEQSDDMTEREADRNTEGEPPLRNFNPFVSTK